MRRPAFIRRSRTRSETYSWPRKVPMASDHFKPSRKLSRSATSATMSGEYTSPRSTVTTVGP